MKIKIALFNVLTVVFALLFILNFGGFTASHSIALVLIKGAVFAFSTKACYTIENDLRRKLIKTKKKPVVVNLSHTRKIIKTAAWYILDKNTKRKSDYFSKRCWQTLTGVVLYYP